MPSSPFRALSVFAVLFLLPSASAQETAAAPYSQRLQAMLTQAAADAALLSSKLPSFVCKETVVSESLSKGKVKQRADVVADLTVRRGADGKLAENFSATQFNGKPFSGGAVRMPLYVTGGFQHAMTYFSAKLRACYHYTLAGNRIDFEAVPDAGERTECSHEVGIKGFALFDADDEMTHTERRVPEDVAKRFKAAPFAAVDLAPVTLNGQTYRLSSRVIAEMPRGKDDGHFEGTYTDCRLFTANITIRPGSTVITEETPNSSPK